MKSIIKYLIPCALIAFSACDSGEEKVETKSTTQESTTTNPNQSEPPKKEEPKKTNVSVGSGGVSVDTKTGTSVKVDSTGVKVGNKDVNISVGTKKKN